MKETIQGLNNIINNLSESSIICPYIIEDNVTIDGYQDLDLVSDLNFDSINLITLVVEIEEAFDIVFPDDKLSLEILRSYKKLYTIIQELIDEENK